MNIWTCLHDDNIEIVSTEAFIESAKSYLMYMLLLPGKNLKPTKKVEGRTANPKTLNFDKGRWSRSERAFTEVRIYSTVKAQVELALKNSGWETKSYANKMTLGRFREAGENKLPERKTNEAMKH